MYVLFSDGDISIAISLLVFIVLAVVAVFWARRYPDHRRNPDKEYANCLLLDVAFISNVITHFVN